MLSFEESLRLLKESGRHHFLVQVRSAQGAEIDFGGRRIVNFCSNDYLGLANDPRLAQGAVEAIRRFGTGSGSSRLVCGDYSLQEELEDRLTRFKGAESTLLFGSGYLASLGVIPALAGEGDVILLDEQSHPSLVDGGRLAGAQLIPYRHIDMHDLESKLKRSVRKKHRTAILTEAVFNARGDVCPLSDVIALADKYGAFLYLDEAHAVGVLGEHGEGLAPRNPPPFLVSLATLGKSFGSYGAFVSGPNILKDFLINTARTFVSTTALPPPSVGAALAALDVIQKEPERRRTLWDRIELASGRLLRMEPLSQILTVVIGSEEKTMEAWGRLMEKGFYLQELLPPLARPGGSGLRLALTSAHTEDHVLSLLDCLAHMSES